MNDLQDRLIREGVSDGLERDLDNVYGLRKALMEGEDHDFGLNGDILKINGSLYISAELFKGTNCITRSDAINAIKPNQDSVFVLTGCGFKNGGRMVGCLGRGAGIYSHIYGINVFDPNLSEEYKNRRLVVFGEEAGDSSTDGMIHRRTSEAADIRHRVFYHGSHKWNPRFMVGMVAARNLVDNEEAPTIDFRMIRKDGSKKHIIHDGEYAIM